MKKITRRTVLRASGLAAASLALSGCAPAGSACVGNGFSGWLQQTFGKGSSASSESTEAAAPALSERLRAVDENERPFGTALIVIVLAAFVK